MHWEKWFLQKKKKRKVLSKSAKLCIKQPKALQMQLKTQGAPQRVKRYDALIRVSYVTAQQVCFTLNPHCSPMWILFLFVGSLGVIKRTQWGILGIQLDESVWILPETSFTDIPIRSVPPAIILKHTFIPDQTRVSYAQLQRRIAPSETQNQDVAEGKQRCKRTDASIQMQE